MNYHWLLPEYIEDVLPETAWHLELLRRKMLDLFRGHGYRLVIPPMLEYLDSLLTGTGHDMDIATFKLVDQLSGRHMGLRADITPQAARIDAHLMNRSGVNRLCYSGSVLRTLPEGSLRTREPLQIGAELFGHAGIEGDVEILGLMIDALALAGVGDCAIDVGHVGVFRSLAREAGLSQELEASLFLALQGKDVPTLHELLRDVPGGEPIGVLADLNGGPEVLARARAELPRAEGIARALDDLAVLADRIGTRAPMSFDLAELRGYHYHSGIVFAAYAPGWPDALAKGGRYDEVGRTFGRARPATGFSLDLRDLALGVPGPLPVGAVLAPPPGDGALEAAVAALRAQGEIVVRDLPGHASDRAELGCDRTLEHVGNAWVIRRIQG